MENARALGQVEAVVGGKAALVPRAVLPIGDVANVRLAVAKVQATPVQVLFLNCHGITPIDACGQALALIDWM